MRLSRHIGSLVELARKQHGTIPHLRFELADATNLNFRWQFDIVTAARTRGLPHDENCDSNSSFELRVRAVLEHLLSEIRPNELIY